MQNPAEDTQWNDALRKHGIIPNKEKEITEEDVIKMVEETVKEKTTKTYAISDEKLLDEDWNEEDDEFFQQYRQQRIAEMKAFETKCKYGDVREITAVDYVDEVNKAGDDVWVLLLLYKPGIPCCGLVQQYFEALAPKFRDVKFLKSLSGNCIPNYPDKNLPTVFAYLGGQMKAQLVGEQEFRGTKLTCDELEWILAKKTGAIKTELKEDPKQGVFDLSSAF